MKYFSPSASNDVITRLDTVVSDVNDDSSNSNTPLQNTKEI